MTTAAENNEGIHLEEPSISGEQSGEQATVATDMEMTAANEESINQETSLTVLIKHGGAEYKIENLLQDHTILYLKEQIEELTNVRACRQKLFGIKTNSGTPITDDLTLDETNMSEGMKIMMMGSQESEIKSIERASRHNQPPLDDDFDADEDDLSDARIPKDPAYMAKIFRRVKHYKIKMLNEPRPGKKLLVLDIDYTLFDHRSTAQSASELMRPYLHEFLTSAYEHYDIVIWSATGMRYIEAKMNELKVSRNPNYKIVFYLDSGAMISVDSQKYGKVLNVKPLAVIWGKFPGQYTPKNTIMFDDTRRNFIMNPQNGLKIKAFREAWRNRDTDQELFLLSIYLNKIASMDDFTSLDHKYWQRAIDAHKRHKTSK